MREFSRSGDLIYNTLEDSRFDSVAGERYFLKDWKIRIQNTHFGMKSAKQLTEEQSKLADIIHEALNLAILEGRL